jgi:hypothetical protein
VGRVSCPHFGHAVTPRLTRAPHTAQGRPPGFVTSPRRPLIPATRTHVDGRHLVPSMTLPPRIRCIRCRLLKWIG